MFKEIGSEFWLDNIINVSNSNRKDWLTQFGEITLTASGRGAITLLLQQVKPKYKTALLPSYICNSMILPFIEEGYYCYFYKINYDLSPDIESIDLSKKIGIFVHMGYYGFPTNANLSNVIEDFRSRSTIIIEDVTHTLFSKYDRNLQNDFYVGSIRKWLGVPSGGFLGSKELEIKNIESTNDYFSELRLQALLEKSEYIKTNDNELKLSFLDKFAIAEELLAKDLSPYQIDNISLNIINSLDINDLVNKRRSNFQFLSAEMTKFKEIKPFFNELSNNICPIFYPIMIKEGRDYVQKELIKNRIYCPIHWPKPDQIENKSLEIYNSILSIPCDQRYDVSDMKRILSILKTIIS